MPLLRDGYGDFFIRGSSLAGALVATAGTVFGTVPPSISRENAGLPSTWIFEHAFLVVKKKMPTPAPELRPGSPHRQDRRTAADTGLHDIEVLPPIGQVWRFVLDVDLTRSVSKSTTSPRDDIVAARALREWEQGRCWLGRKVARGLGWMRLTKCDVFRLGSGQVDSWPDSSAPSLADRITKLRTLGVSGIELDCFITQVAEPQHYVPVRHYLRWTGTARAGEYRPDDEGPGYGLDTLEIGGHGSHYMVHEEFGKGHFVASDEIGTAGLDDIKPDMALAMIRRLGKDNKPTLEPFIPGTSLAGSFRHWLSRRLRTEGEGIWDPVAQSDYRESGAACDLDCVELLLGTRRGSGSDTRRLASSLLFREAYISETARDAWSATCQERVALDPYRQNPVAGAKFNRYVLLGAEFEWQLILELDAESPERDNMISFVESFLKATSSSHIAFGGGEARGHGHLAFSVVLREQARAGDPDWQMKETFMVETAS